MCSRLTFASWGFISDDELATERERQNALTKSSRDWFYYTQQHFFRKRMRGEPTTGILVKPPSPPRQLSCGNYGKRDHCAKDCPQGQKCFRCRQMGHWARKRPYSAHIARMLLTLEDDLQESNQIREIALTMPGSRLRKKCAKSGSVLRSVFEMYLS